MDLEILSNKCKEIYKHYGACYQLKRLRIEEFELENAQRELVFNDMKRHLANYKKENFEIKTIQELMNNLISEIADVIVLMKQCSRDTFSNIYKSVIFKYRLQQYECDCDFKDLVMLQVELKIDRQLERIKNV